MRMRPLFVPALATVLALAAHAPAWADYQKDLSRFTLFGKTDLNQLADGTVLGERGDLPAHPRGITVETLFFVPHPPATTANRVREWSPRLDSDLGVYAHKRISIPPKPEDFSALGNLPNTAPVSRLRSATLALNPKAPDLYMSRQEAQGISAAKASSGGTDNKAFADFWGKLLYGRAQAALTEGIFFTPPYDVRGNSIPVSAEINALLASNKRVRSQFGRLVAFSRLAGRYADEKTPPLPELTASKGIKTSAYWEVFNVQGDGTINLGVTYALGAKSGQWQVIDCQYYVSGGYIASIVLYQMWPATISGREGTLVWRGDLLSSPGFTYVRGVERKATGMVMLKEVQKSVEMLQRDISQ